MLRRRIQTAEELRHKRIATSIADLALMVLNDAFPDDRYQAFARANAASIWAKDRDAANHLGFWWAGPFDLPDAARQSSALDALTAAAALGSGKHQ